MDGNMFWKVRVTSLVSSASPEKLLRTSSADLRIWDPIERGRDWLFCTSRSGQYALTLNVSVGPRGRRPTRMLVPTSVLVKLIMCVTPSGPAMCTKSRITFFFRTRSFSAV